MNSKPYSASQYIESTRLNVDPIRHEVLIPSVLSLLGNIQDKCIADVGCGPGMFIDSLMKHKPKKIKAYDISNDMLFLFNKNFPSIESFQLDITTTPLHKKEFDIVLSILVLHTIESLEIALSNLAKGLLNQGELIICVPHPCFHYSQSQVNAISNKNYTHKKYYLDSSYYLEKKIFNYFGKPKVKVQMFHRSISQYVNSLLRAGLVITALHESKKHSLKPWNCIPPFLFLKAQKL